MYTSGRDSSASSGVHEALLCSDPGGHDLLDPCKSAPAHRSKQVMLGKNLVPSICKHFKAANATSKFVVQDEQSHLHLSFSICGGDGIWMLKSMVGSFVKRPEPGEVAESGMGYF